MKTIIATLTLIAVLLALPAAVSADTVETKVECTTGAYGQQTCKTVEVKKVLGETTIKTHETKDAGLAENIMLMTVGLMVISGAGVVYAHRSS